MVQPDKESLDNNPGHPSNISLDSDAAPRMSKIDERLHPDEEFEKSGQLDDELDELIELDESDPDETLKLDERPTDIPPAAALKQDEQEE